MPRAAPLHVPPLLRSAVVAIVVAAATGCVGCEVFDFGCRTAAVRASHRRVWEEPSEATGGSSGGGREVRADDYGDALSIIREECGEHFQVTTVEADTRRSSGRQKGSLKDGVRVRFECS